MSHQAPQNAHYSPHHKSLPPFLSTNGTPCPTRHHKTPITLPITNISHLSSQLTVLHVPPDTTKRPSLSPSQISPTMSHQTPQNAHHSAHHKSLPPFLSTNSTPCPTRHHKTPITLPITNLSHLSSQLTVLHVPPDTTKRQSLSPSQISPTFPLN